MEKTLESARDTVIDRPMCLALLATQQVGRLVVGGPTIRVRPVNYVAVGDNIYFRTGHHLSEGTAVVFEVDRIDAVERQGWSVIVDGHVATSQTDEITTDVLDRLAPWPPVEKPQLTKIEIDVVTGRRVCAERELTGTDGRGYR